MALVAYDAIKTRGDGDEDLLFPIAEVFTKNVDEKQRRSIGSVFVFHLVAI